MQTWAYPAVIEKHGPEDFVVTFPDVPEAITGGASLDEARLNAADALEEAILGYMAQGLPIPAPRAERKGEELVVLDPVTAARAGKNPH
jgi:antitoxin HicB